jgi:AcrR family transcriptional regulator
VNDSTARRAPSRQTAKGTRAERGERSRETILDAAITLFAERGYDGVSLDDVTARSGAKRSLILYYYRNKDELWRTAAEEVARLFNAAVARKMAHLSPAGDATRLRQNTEAWLDAFQEEPQFARFMVREGGAPGPRLDFLVEHFGYAQLQFKSEELRRRLGETILRDAMLAVYLAMTALGPLLDRSLAQASKKKTTGIYPLSAANREALVEILMRMAGPIPES